jgi:hypothetical protein
VTAYKLLLHPDDPDRTPPGAETLAAGLQELGFIGAPVALAHGVFYPTGENFLQLLTFLGCSPAIELDPPADPAALEAARRRGSFVHVYVESGPQLRLRADPRTPPPRCPACRQPDADWSDAVDAWREDPAALAWTCPHCGYTGRLTDLRFRRTAAFARAWIEVRGIHPSEAVPNNALIARLRALAGCDWRYLYLQE